MWFGDVWGCHFGKVLASSAVHTKKASTMCCSEKPRLRSVLHSSSLLFFMCQGCPFDPYLDRTFNKTRSSACGRHSPTWSSCSTFGPLVVSRNIKWCHLGRVRWSFRFRLYFPMENAEVPCFNLPGMLHEHLNTKFEKNVLEVEVDMNGQSWALSKLSILPCSIPRKKPVFLTESYNLYEATLVNLTSQSDICCMVRCFWGDVKSLGCF